MQLLADALLSHTIRIAMTKDAPVAFRIESDLKKRLLKAAKQEARSLSQICEMLLTIGMNEYDQKGHRFLKQAPMSKRAAGPD
jgi:hypothetical protein